MVLHPALLGNRQKEGKQLKKQSRRTWQGWGQDSSEGSHVPGVGETEESLEYSHS